MLRGETFPPAPVQERSRRKRDRLLAAGLDLFAVAGYEATTVDAIARRAQAATGAFYQHFASKRQLLLVLVDRLLAELEAMEIPAAILPEAARPAIAVLVRSGLEADWSYAGAYRAWREAVLVDARLAALDRRVAAWTTSRIAVALGTIARLPVARGDLDIGGLSSVLNTLFWQLAQTPAPERPRVVAVATALVEHALLRDATTKDAR